MRFFLQTESVTNNNKLRSEYNANYIEGLSESWCNDCLSSSMKIMKWGCGWSMSSLSSAASWCFFHIICDSSKQQGQFIIIYMYIYEVCGSHSPLWTQHPAVMCLSGWGLDISSTVEFERLPNDARYFFPPRLSFCMRKSGRVTWIIPSILSVFDDYDDLPVPPGGLKMH